MPGDSKSLTRKSVQITVSQIISDVLVVPVDDVMIESSLMDDLGAESMDFLDLIFRLEQQLGKAITLPVWEEFLQERFPRGRSGASITTALVIEFVEYARAQATQER